MSISVDYVPAEKDEWSYLDKFFSLLAEEKLNVVRSSAATTASINLTTRTCTIPAFAVKDKDIFLLMGSHEVSHALHTPPDWYVQHNTDASSAQSLYATCVNIVEDIRIERMIRNKFPGFVHVYIRGYKKLLGEGFFSLESWAKFKTHDRVNAYAKLGKSLPIDMTQSDICIYKYVASAKTFEDVRIRAQFLANIVKIERNTTPDMSSDELQDMINKIVEDATNELPIGGEAASSGELPDISDDDMEKIASAVEDALKSGDSSSNSNQAADDEKSSVDTKIDKEMAKHMAVGNIVEFMVPSKPTFAPTKLFSSNVKVSTKLGEYL